MEGAQPEGGFMAVELLDRLIADGIESVKRAYDEGTYKLEGALEGFEIARTLPATYEDFDWAVTQRLEAEREIRQAMRDDRTEETQYEYWRHRWGTLQLEYCRNVLLVGKHASGESLPPGTALSARAVMRYAALVGVAEV